MNMPYYRDPMHNIFIRSVDSYLVITIPYFSLVALVFFLIIKILKVYMSEIVNLYLNITLYEIYYN